MFSSALPRKRPPPPSSTRPHKRPRYALHPLFVLHPAQNNGSHSSTKRVALTLDPVISHSDPIRNSPLQRAALSSTSFNGVASRYSPYPPHKPTRNPPARSTLSSRTNVDCHSESFVSSVYGIPDVYDFTYSSVYDADPLSSDSWKHIPTAAQSNWCTLSVRSGSPCSEDSAIVTPVSEQGHHHQPFIQGDEHEGLFTQGYGAFPDSWQYLYSQDTKRLCRGSELQPTQSYPDNAVIGQGPGCGFETLQETIPESAMPLLKQHDNVTPSAYISPSCSFATTFPQFISPVSDSAVTSTPQALPLYAPRPVRPIPKVCFAAPEEDTLPTTSILFKPVSDSLRHAGWSGISGSEMWERINSWTISS